MYLSDLKVLVIYNPMAGKGKIKRLMPQVKSMYEKAGLKPLFHATKCRDDAYRIAKAFIKKFYNAVKPEADDRKHSLYVIAAGGDGTLNEVMRGVLDTGCDVPIGIIPAGSTNDFGYSLGINNGMLDAAEKALNAILMDEVFKCDVATFNGKYITYTAAFGLFSDVSYATPQNFKNRFGHSAYIMYGAKNILKTRKIHTRIMYKDDKILRSVQDDNQGDLDTVDVNDGQECTGNSWKTIEGDMLLGMVVSAKSVGGFRGITGSGVELDDGKNELMFVRWPNSPKKFVKTITHAIGMARKSPKAREKAFDQSEESGIKIIRVSEARFLFDKPTAWALDGEDGGAQTEDEIVVKKQAVSYLVV